MSSSAGASGSAGGGAGILRSSGGGKKRPAQNNTMEVTFGGAVAETMARPTRPSPSDQEYDEYDGRAGRAGNGGNGGSNGGGGEYDSDDLFDASMAAGGALPSTTLNRNNGGGEDAANDDDDGLPHGQADIDAAKRRRRKYANAELADRAEEIERLEEEEDQDVGGDSGRGNGQMGSTSGGGGDGQSRQKGGEFRGEEDLDAGLSLISSTADTTNDPSAISGAYDAGANATCPVEPFNLKAEREGGEGYFDGDTYVFRRLEEGGRAMDEEPDAWLDELGGQDVNGGAAHDDGGIARLANARTSSSNKKKQPTLDLDDVPHEELCGRIAALLASDNETVARGLKRYGDVLGRERKRRQKLAKRQRGKKGGAGAENDEKKDTAKMDIAEDDASGVAAAQQALSDLTELADALLVSGDGEVYSRTREELVRMASASGTAGGEMGHLAGHKRKRNYFGGDGEDANNGNGNGDSSSKMAKTDGATAETDQADKKPPVQWEYRGNQDQQIHGPYTTEQMLGWIQAGYFVGEAAVDVRRVASVNGGGEVGAANKDAATKAAAETATADDLMADLMDSDDEGGGDEEAKTETNTTIEWERSDKVDFKSYL